MSISSVKTGAIGVSLLAGNAYYLPSDYESIATVSVGSGGTSAAEFTSIPSTYTHLQIRGIARSTGGANWFDFKLNGNAYTKSHTLEGDGATVSTDSHSIVQMVTSSQTANCFSVFVIDVLDYTNTNKNKTVRSISGRDVNGSGGRVSFCSEFLNSTSAITSLSLVPDISTSFAQYSHIALYGIKS